MNRHGHFDALARTLHWLMAVMILAMLFIGAGMVASLAWRPTLLDLHRPLGIAILLMVIVRLLNRLRSPPPPPTTAGCAAMAWRMGEAASPPRRPLRWPSVWEPVHLWEPIHRR